MENYSISFVLRCRTLLKCEQTRLIVTIATQ